MAPSHRGGLLRSGRVRATDPMRVGWWGGGGGLGGRGEGLTCVAGIVRAVQELCEHSVQGPPGDGDGDLVAVRCEKAGQHVCPAGLHRG